MPLPRDAGNVYLTNASVEAKNPNPTLVAADTTTSGGVVLISVNTTGAQLFTITNSGSINIYIEGSFNGVFFQPSVPVQRIMTDAASAPSSTVNAVSASTIAMFEYPFYAVRVVANSGSGVYRPALTYR